MTKFEPGKEIKMLICEQMGEDLDHSVCAELSRYMAECPDCKVYYDSVKKIIKLYRTCEHEQEVPDEVSDRLFKVLNLKPDPE